MIGTKPSRIEGEGHVVQKVETIGTNGVAHGGYSTNGAGTVKEHHLNGTPTFANGLNGHKLNGFPLAPRGSYLLGIEPDLEPYRSESYNVGPYELIPLESIGDDFINVRFSGMIDKSHTLRNGAALSKSIPVSQDVVLNKRDYRTLVGRLDICAQVAEAETGTEVGDEAVRQFRRLFSEVIEAHDPKLYLENSRLGRYK